MQDIIPVVFAKSSVKRSILIDPYFFIRKINISLLIIIIFEWTVGSNRINTAIKMRMYQTGKSLSNQTGFEMNLEEIDERIISGDILDELRA